MFTAMLTTSQKQISKMIFTKASQKATAVLSKNSKSNNFSAEILYFSF